MRKVLSLLLALIMCLSLCACGKSEAVKNVEVLIAAIGEVTLDSEAAIVAAETAYNALTDEEKAKVENIAMLTEAREVLDVAVFDDFRNSLVTEWVTELKADRFLTLSADGSVTLIDPWSKFTGTWELSPDMAVIHFTLDGLTFDADLIPENGFIQLSALAVLGQNFVRREDYQAAFEQKFVAVELSEENVKDYLGDAVFIGNALDEWGEEYKDSPCYMLTSMVYDDGLVYVGCSDDFAVELVVDTIDRGETYTVGATVPFDYTNNYCGGVHKSVSISGRAKGTMYFVKPEYVANNYYEDMWTYVELTNGTLYTTGFIPNVNFNYADFMH